MRAAAPVGIVGCGLVGRAWAIAFARGGCEVALFDAAEGVAARAAADIPGTLDDLDGRDLLDGQTPDEIIARVRVAATLDEAVGEATYVQESAREDLAIKSALYAEMDRLASPETVLASSTSFIVPSAFAEGLAGAARILVAHPVNPPYLVPAVELVPGPVTSDAAMGLAADVLESIGQSVIAMTAEVSGFVMNRLQAALLNEAFDLVARGFATVEGVDRGVRDGLGLRWSFMGPFETIDLNAPGGLADYVERYGAPYREIVASQESAGWSGAALAGIDAARREALPLDALPDRQRWRDRRLMALAAYRRHVEEKET
ncbi:MAG: 3-hydroxyacyl-CoA dehydrogenase [Pseudomonadota bacterium]